MFRRSAAYSEEEFWSLFDKDGPVPEHDPTLGPCWIWQGPRGWFDYGLVRYKKVYWKIHRLSYALTNGDPGSLLVLHHCDNPPCGNPQHLYGGNQSQNLKDCHARGRATGAFTPHVVKLTFEDRQRIKELHEEGMSLRALATQYNVSAGTIWDHLEKGPYQSRRIRNERVRVK